MPSNGSKSRRKVGRPRKRMVIEMRPTHYRKRVRRRSSRRSGSKVAAIVGRVIRRLM